MYFPFFYCINMENPCFWKSRTWIFHFFLRVSIKHMLGLSILQVVFLAGLSISQVPSENICLKSMNHCQGAPVPISAHSVSQSKSRSEKYFAFTYRILAGRSEITDGRRGGGRARPPPPLTTTVLARPASTASTASQVALEAVKARLLWTSHPCRRWPAHFASMHTRSRSRSIMGLSFADEHAEERHP